MRAARFGGLSIHIRLFVIIACLALVPAASAAAPEATKPVQECADLHWGLDFGSGHCIDTTDRACMVYSYQYGPTWYNKDCHVGIEKRSAPADCTLGTAPVLRCATPGPCMDVYQEADLVVARIVRPDTCTTEVYTAPITITTAGPTCREGATTGQTTLVACQLPTPCYRIQMIDQDAAVARIVMGDTCSFRVDSAALLA